jgi:hypothetical protein
MYDETNTPEKNSSEVSVVILTILFALNLVATYYYFSVFTSVLHGVKTLGESYGVGFAFISIPLFAVFLTIPYAVLSGVAFIQNKSNRKFIFLLNIVSVISILLLIIASYSTYSFLYKAVN